VSGSTPAGGERQWWASVSSISGQGMLCLRDASWRTRQDLERLIGGGGGDHPPPPPGQFKGPQLDWLSPQSEAGRGGE